MFTEAEMQGACDIARRKGEEAARRAVATRRSRRSTSEAATLSTIAQQTAAIAKNIAAERRRPASRPIWRWRSAQARRWWRQGLAEIDRSSPSA
jgi:hypothetical protein